MLYQIKAKERGHAKIDWLDSYHSFSFGSYYNPERMGFGNLRVINEDFIAPANGFGTHPHANMEIVTFVIDGAVAHIDSLGNEAVIYPNQVQRMSAGTGISHSEFNYYDDRTTHLYQLWFLPKKKDITPSYQQRDFGGIEAADSWQLLVSHDGRENSLSVNQDLDIYYGSFVGDKIFKCDEKHHIWIQIIEGEVKINGVDFSSSDGGAFLGDSQIKFTNANALQLLIFDIA